MKPQTYARFTSLVSSILSGNFFSYKLMLGSCVQQAQNLLFKSSPFQGDYPP